MNTNNIVQKLWNYCNVLRDDGMKMADERTRRPAVEPNCPAFA